MCSAPSAATIVSSPPTAPTAGTATSPAPGQIVFPFTASTYAGYPAIQNYTVKCITGAATPQSCAASGAGVVSAIVSATANPLQATFSGLVTGTSYTCYAIAFNGVAPGDVCSGGSNGVTVVGAPSAPAVGQPSSSGVGLLSVPFTPSTDLGYPSITTTNIKCINIGVATASCGATGTGVFSTSVPIGASPTASFSSLPGGSYVCYAGELKMGPE